MTYRRAVLIFDREWGGRALVGGRLAGGVGISEATFAGRADQVRPERSVQLPAVRHVIISSTLT